MRSSDAAVHKQHDRFHLKRSGKSGRQGLPISEETSQTLEISVRRINRSSSNLHTVSRLNTGQWSSQMGQSELKQAANIPLPPIRGCRPGRGEVPAAPPAIRNTILHVFVAKWGKPIQQSDRLSEIHSRPALAERLEQQKKSDDITGVDGGRTTTMPVIVKDDGGACEERRRQREFCSDDSAAETSSEDSEVTQRHWRRTMAVMTSTTASRGSQSGSSRSTRASSLQETLREAPSLQRSATWPP